MKIEKPILAAWYMNAALLFTQPHAIEMIAIER